MKLIFKFLDFIFRGKEIMAKIEGIEDSDDDEDDEEDEDDDDEDDDEDEDDEDDDEEDEDDDMESEDIVPTDLTEEVNIIFVKLVLLLNDDTYLKRHLKFLKIELFL